MKGGLDLGGTKIQAVVVGKDAKVLGKARHPTPLKGGPPHIAAAMAEALVAAAHDAGAAASNLEGVGVGSPGAVDSSKGTVSHAGNLSGWHGSFNLGRHLGKSIGAPVFVDNDVRVATRAEFLLGAGKGYESILGTFWGTGVGGGIILRGEPWFGRGAAGEIGHMVVKDGGAKCGCGRRGCVEAYAGRGALEARARKLVKRGQKTKLFDIMERTNRPRLTSGVWAKALNAKDGMATELIGQAVEALGAGIASAVNLLDVDAVVIGGGLGTRLGAPYARAIEQAMLPHLFVSDRPPPVHVAALGDLGGAIGASLLVH